MLTMLYYSLYKRRGVRPDYIHSQTLPIALPESPQP